MLGLCVVAVVFFSCTINSLGCFFLAQVPTADPGAAVGTLQPVSPEHEAEQTDHEKTQESRYKDPGNVVLLQYRGGGGERRKAAMRIQAMLFSYSIRGGGGEEKSRYEDLGNVVLLQYRGGGGEEESRYEDPGNVVLLQY